MPFSKQNRRTTLALLGVVASLNAGSVYYVVQSGQNTARQNCEANDAQNHILVTLINESLRPVEGKAGRAAYDKLTSKQKHAVRVFKEQRHKLDIPTC